MSDDILDLVKNAQNNLAQIAYLISVTGLPVVSKNGSAESMQTIKYYKDRLERSYETVNALVDHIGRFCPTSDSCAMDPGDMIVVKWKGEWERFRVLEVHEFTIKGRIIRYQDEVTIPHCDCVLLEEANEGQIPLRGQR